VLFVDEVRANTSQKQYGNIGGRKFFATRGTCPQEKKAYSDCQFTVLGFTIVNGVPIMCALIIAAKKTTALETSGINYLSEDFLEPGTLEEKTTKDEYRNRCDRLFLMGPKYEYKGKGALCFVWCSKIDRSHVICLQ
jgi:hypothetical protein